VIVMSLQVVGVALVLAMLVTPASAAYLWSRRLPPMMAIAAGFGSISALIGLLLSYHLNLASGPAIVLVETGLFGLAFLVSPRRRSRLRPARVN
jgi:ABC-type Mn2+/Zn2+ transport system permease subunit